MTFRATHTFTPSSHALRTPLLLAKRNERDILYEAPAQVRGSHGSALPPPSLRLLPAVASTLVSLVLAPFALHSHLVVVQLAVAASILSRLLQHPRCSCGRRSGSVGSRARELEPAHPCWPSQPSLSSDGGAADGDAAVEARSR